MPRVVLSRMIAKRDMKMQADFDHPIELMMDCHRRIEHFMDVLVTVAQRLRGAALDRENRDSLQTALNYFRSAAPRHTEDEEQSLFPRMRRSSDSGIQTVLMKIAALESEHIKAQTAHARIDILAQRWLNEGRLPEPAADKLLQLVTELRAAYARHIRIEDAEVFPAATRLLDEDQVSAIGREMAERRQQNPGRPGSRCAERRMNLAPGIQQRRGPKPRDTVLVFDCASHAKTPPTSVWPSPSHLGRTRTRCSAPDLTSSVNTFNNTQPKVNTPSSMNTTTASAIGRCSRGRRGRRGVPCVEGGQACVACWRMV